ncbi:37695_t:CDS:1 [Gigaspora margarita]|uniref:37695_t:CDS:1 n=1 Tax=Gigaspora margarita TaxID=4874 RepID=A0ABM8VVM1_GIGMA|nr:37695_t:CDS:1 [Gigaspora margarita]
MNPNIPEEKQFIEDLTWEYIHLSEILGYKETFVAYSKDKEDKIVVQFKDLYTGTKLLKKLQKLKEALQIEISRVAKKYLQAQNKELFIYNCFENKNYYFYFNILYKFEKYIKILQEETPVDEYNRQEIQENYKYKICCIIQKQVPGAILYKYKPIAHNYYGL